jgi:hypothetical protein
MATSRRCASLALAFLLVTAPFAAAQSSVPADAVAKFMGTWALSFEGGPQGAFTITVSVKAEGGQAAVETSSDMDPTPIKVKDVAKVGDDLVLKYLAGPSGDFPIKLTLTPDGDKVKSTLDVADGQFSMSGTGTKKN